MRIVLPRRKARTDIDMLPMINFAFLLLIFFLMVGRFGPQDVFKVTPPRAADLSPQPDAQAMSLLLGADGALAFGPSRTDAAELREHLALWRREHPNQPLLLKADATADATQLLGLLQQVRDACVSEVRLLTRPAP